MRAVATGSCENHNETMAVPAARWYAVQTRPRHEKAVSSRLNAALGNCYLPLLDEVHYWSDRRKVVQVPLFPCYVFVHMEFSSQTYRSVQQTPNVLRLLGTKPDECGISEDEIANIRTVLTERISFSPYPFIRIGQRVRIRGGCLDGVTGILVANQSDQSLVISVELIQRSVAIKVQGFDIEPVGHS